MIKNGDPAIVRFFKWGGIIAGGIIAMSTVGGFLVVTAVKWVALPLINDSERRGYQRDSLIVSRVEALTSKVELIALGLQSNPGSLAREQVLDAVPQVEPQRAILPKDTRPAPAKK